MFAGEARTFTDEHLAALETHIRRDEYTPGIDTVVEALAEIRRLREIIRTHTDCPCADVQAIKR